MKKKLFRYFLILGLTAVALCCALMLGVMARQTESRTFDLLAEEAGIAARCYELAGEEGLRGIDTASRLTLVDADGTVRLDTQADPREMENHLNRGEIAEALDKGSGQTIHRSETLMERTLYYAVKLSDGGVLRVARTQSSSLSVLIGNLPLILGIAAVLALLCVALSARLSYLLVEPINRIDPERPGNDGVYPELLPLVERLRRQNRTIREEMENREALRAEFSANVSHELKTPLTTISGYAELMKEGMMSPEKTKDAGETIFRECRRLIQLVGDIINLSRLDTGKELSGVEPVDLYALAGEVLESLKPAAERKNVRMTLAGKSRTIEGHPRALHEMLYNLCDNAVKYNREGGRVWVEVSADGDRTRLIVEDTGIGIPPEDQPRVFERFYRVDKSRSRSLGGTGLGLSIVKHAAQLHHADVDLESTPGKGSRFILTF